MNLEPYRHLIPEIEAKIAESRLDTIVFGLGPTAWLLPWIDRSLIAPLKLWGCHDASRILPVHDLVLMDFPNKPELHPDTSRYAEIVKARPNRLWVWRQNLESWAPHLPACMAKVLRPVDWKVFNPASLPRMLASLGQEASYDRPPLQLEDLYDRLPFRLVDDPPQTVAVSPSGMTTLAWQQGCRRIGVLGVDMMKHHHHTYMYKLLVDAFFLRLRKDAHDLGGLIVNLSPISSLRRFREWTPSTSGSEATSGSSVPGPSQSLSTASAATPPAQ